MESKYFLKKTLIKGLALRWNFFTQWKLPKQMETNFKKNPEGKCIPNGNHALLELNMEFFESFI